MAFTVQTPVGSDAFNTQLKADLTAAGWVSSWALTANEVDPVTGQTLVTDQYTFVSPTGVVASFKYTPANSNGIAHIDFVGAVKVNTGAGWFNQHSVSSPVYNIPLDGVLGMKYWLSVTDNRINMMWKISASYFVASVGRFLPYALPTEYPHPLFIGSVQRGKRDWRDALIKTFIYSQDSNDMASFMDVSGLWQDFAGPNSTLDQNGFTLDYMGEQNYINKDGNNGTTGFINKTHHEKLYPCLGGGHHVKRALIQHRGGLEDYTSGVTFGALDGFRRVMGIGQVPENTLTIGPLGFITCQNVTANSPLDYYAMETI